MQLNASVCNRTHLQRLHAQMEGRWVESRPGTSGAHHPSGPPVLEPSAFAFLLGDFDRKVQAAIKIQVRD